MFHSMYKENATQSLLFHMSFYVLEITSQTVRAGVKVQGRGRHLTLKTESQQLT